MQRPRAPQVHRVRVEGVENPRPTVSTLLAFRNWTEEAKLGSPNKAGRSHSRKGKQSEGSHQRLWRCREGDPMSSGSSLPSAGLAGTVLLHEALLGEELLLAIAPLHPRLIPIGTWITLCLTPPEGGGKGMRSPSCSSPKPKQSNRQRTLHPEPATHSHS